MKNLPCLFYLTLTAVTAFSQNVGIGTTTPSHKLDVVGTIRGSTILATSWVGINNPNPIYRLHINDGSLAISNTSDNAIWVMSYNSADKMLTWSYNGATRLVLENTGNVGIGQFDPIYKLDVNGSLRTTSSAYINSNLYVDGNVTVNNGKGILRNSHGSGQLKYYSRTVSASTGNMAGFAQSPEFAIGFASGVFTNPPKVLVGDIVSTGGTVGQLYRVLLITYDVTTTGCKARLVNTSPNAVNYSITWNIVCIGD